MPWRPALSGDALLVIVSYLTALNRGRGNLLVVVVGACLEMDKPRRLKRGLPSFTPADRLTLQMNAGIKLEGGRQVGKHSLRAHYPFVCLPVVSLSNLSSVMLGGLWLR